jgi:amino acid adenylation domain-containing protein
MITKQNTKDIYPLSPLQQGMFFHSLYDETSTAYFEQMSFHLRGDLNIGYIEKSLNELFKRHDILRTVFTQKTGKKLFQLVLKERTVDFYYEDISRKDNKGEYIETFKKEDKQRSFDLTRDVLMRLAIFQVDKAEYEFIWSHHHILMDGWCVGILVSEFFEIYNSFLENRSYQLPLVTPYRVYIDWLQKQDKTKAKNYWKSYLEGYEKKASVPKLKTKKSLDKGYKDAQVVLTLEKEKTAMLNHLAESNRVTLNIVTRAIWGILLGKYSDLQDVVFGAVVSGRPSEIEGVETMIGLFINTVPVRLRCKDDTPFDRFLQDVQEQDVESNSYHYLPLVDVQAQSTLKQDLLDHFIVFENYPRMDRVEGTSAGSENKNKNKNVASGFSNVNIYEQTNYDFFLMIIPGTQLTIRFKYNENQYNNRFVRRIANHFEQFINQVLLDDGIPIDELTLLSPEEKREILEKFNDTKADYPKEKTIHRLFEEQVEKSSEKIALMLEGQVLSYRKLNEKANQVARMLKRDCGVAAGDIVGICIHRSLEMIISIIGILKSGAACLPIDAKYPKERIGLIMNDSAMKALLKSAQLDLSSVQPHVVDVDGNMKKVLSYERENIENHRDAKELAYVIYTSGSTGRPKGVMLHHFGISNHMFTKINQLELDENDICCHNLSIGFVASIWQIFAPLVLGAQLHIYPEDIISSAYNLFRSVNNDNISVLEVVPSLMDTYLRLLESGEKKVDLSNLRILVLTGEKVLPSLVNRFYNIYSTYAIDLVNAYGQSEFSDDTLHYRLSAYTKVAIMPVGHPSFNTQVYVLDSKKRLQPVGVPGELYIGGHGLAVGYLNRTRLTVERFVPNPFIEGEKIFKTGDRVRWLPDGNIEFLGRVDNQVKIRGFRVELGEIESVLASHPLVEQVVVTARENKNEDKYLCAYYVSVSPKKGEETELKHFLSQKLPDYMVPAFLVQIEAVPLTPSGKIDRKSLPEPTPHVEEAYKAPRDEVEKRLVAIYSGVLNRDPNTIGTNANFFEQLGGDSLKVIMIISKIHRALEVEIPLMEFFEHPTIEWVAGFINGAQKTMFTPLVPTEKKEYYPLSSAQKRLFFMHQVKKNNTVYHVTQIVVLGGDLEIVELEETFRKLITRHECLRASFRLVEGEPVQQVQDNVDFTIEYFDLETEDPEEPIIRSFVRSFDLSQAPLLRVGLIHQHTHKQENIGSRYILMVDMHHIISDGTSIQILIKDFLVLFRGEELQPLKLHYKDYSEWQDREKENGKIREQEVYWLKKFDGELPVLYLPIDFPRPKIQSFEGHSLSFEIDEEKTRALEELAASMDVTLYMVLLAVLNIMVSKICHQEDVIIGTPVAGRRHADLENIVGMFANTLALWNQPSGHKSVTQFLEELRENTLEAFENQDFQWDELVQKLGKPKDPGRSPIFDVMFALETQNDQMEASKLVEFHQSLPSNAANAADYPNSSHAPGLVHMKTHNNTHFDLLLVGTKFFEKLVFLFEYSTRLFKEKTINAFGNYFKKIVDAVLQDPGRRIGDIEILNAEETAKLVEKIKNKKGALFAVNRNDQQQAKLEESEVDFDF